MEIQVKGHSGCQIDIVNENANLYIYKSSYDRKYMPRLLLQANKQKEAGKKQYQHIRIPEIYSISESATCLSVKMEYVYSKNFVAYFEDAGFDQINYFVKALKIYIDAEIAGSPITRINSEVVRAKFRDVQARCFSNQYINGDDEVIGILRSSQAFFEGLPDEMEIPLGVCHGDLTFSNILFNGNNYYLIDFLDSFVESPLLDLVKIRQDSRYGWSRLMYTDKLDPIRLGIISDKIDAEIDEYYSRYPWYSDYYQVFQLMNFLRVLQYAKEEKIVTYLKNILWSMINH